MASLVYDLILIGTILIMGYSLIASSSSDTVSRGVESQNISVGDAMETVRTIRRGSSDSRLSLKDDMQAQAIEMDTVKKMMRKKFREYQASAINSIHLGRLVRGKKDSDRL